MLDSSVDVDALFVDPKGPYPRMLGPEHCWDEKRDARTYAGTGPLILHPPCAAWCLLAGMREARHGYPRGEDGGLFLFALKELRRCGGVLEHPAYSKAWDRYGLPRPKKGGGWQEWTTGGGRGRWTVWVCQVSQCAYGHRARKRTWLIYCGERPPFDLDWSESYKGGVTISGCANRSRMLGQERMGSAEAKRTPDAFAEVLIALARHAAG